MYIQTERIFLDKILSDIAWNFSFSFCIVVSICKYDLTSLGVTLEAYHLPKKCKRSGPLTTGVKSCAACGLGLSIVFACGSFVMPVS